MCTSSSVCVHIDIPAASTLYSYHTLDTTLPTIRLPVARWRRNCKGRVAREECIWFEDPSPSQKQGQKWFAHVLFPPSIGQELRLTFLPARTVFPLHNRQRVAFSLKAVVTAVEPSSSLRKPQSTGSSAFYLRVASPACLPRAPVSLTVCLVAM